MKQRFEYMGMEYEMEPEAIEAAYRYQAGEYARADCKAHLQDMADNKTGYIDEYGINISEAMKYTDEMVSHYFHDMDANISENDMWKGVIDAVLNEHAPSEKTK